MGVIIDIDGVMRHPYNSQPIREGFALYHMIRDKVKVTFICEDKKLGEVFLRSNKILKFDLIEDTKSMPPGDDVWVRLIKKHRVRSPIDYVVTANIDLIQPLLEQGIVTLAFCAPSYLDAKFFPDTRKGMKTWSEVKEEIERQQELLSQDGRL